MTTRRRRIGETVMSIIYMAGAIGCFSLAIYSILLDRAGSAGVAATFSVAFLFLRHLPIIESFKAFNMEAKFARRVDEFDKLLGHIRSIAEGTCRLLYMQLGFSGRMTSMDWGRKREFLEELDRKLADLDVDPEFIRSAKRPVLNFAVWDIYRVFDESAHALLERRRREITEAQRAIFGNGPINMSHPEWNALQRQRDALAIPSTNFEDMSGRTELEDVGAITSRVLGAVNYPPEDRALLEKIAEEVEVLADACWEGGTITPEAQAYIEKYSGNRGARLAELEGAGG